jgi:hypothetical protein
LTHPTSSAEKARAGRRFGLTVGGAFALLAAVSWWRGHAWPPMVLGTLGAALLLAALLLPRQLGPVERAWMRLAHAISRITTPILVGALFYLVLTPIGLIMRAFGRNVLRHPLVDDSYWIVRDRAQRGRMTEKF